MKKIAAFFGGIFLIGVSVPFILIGFFIALAYAATASGYDIARHFVSWLEEKAPK